VLTEIGVDDAFVLNNHIQDTQSGIENHHSGLITAIVNVFYKLRIHHMA